MCGWEQLLGRFYEMELCTLAVCIGLAAFTVYAATYSVFFEDWSNEIEATGE